jgi:hypothetical protein
MLASLSTGFERTSTTGWSGRSVIRGWRRWAEGALAVLTVVVARTAVSALAARRVAVNIMGARAWDRWDTGLYKDIATHGYILGRCGDIFPTGPYPPTSWCGNTAWFPLYPLAMRAGSAVGLSLQWSGRLLSLAFFVAILGVVWTAFLVSTPRPQRYLLLVLVAFFPGSVYYGAIFPISLAALGCMSALALLRRHRLLAAGIAAAVGAAAYPPVLLIAVLGLVVFRLTDPSRRWRDALLFTTPVLVAGLAVEGAMWIYTGRWNAFFLAQEHYNYSARSAVGAYLDRFTVLFDGTVERRDGPPLQTVLVLGLIGVVAVVLAMHRRTVGRIEGMAGVLVLTLWIVPVVLGGQLAIYRSEALLAPIVVLLRRAPLAVVAAFAFAAIPVAFEIDFLFFANYLI